MKKKSFSMLVAFTLFTGFCTTVVPVVANGQMIQNETIRIKTIRTDGKLLLAIELREQNGEWQTILGNGMVTTKNIYDRTRFVSVPDPQIDWKTGGADAKLQSIQGIYSESKASSDGKSLTLTGMAEGHSMEMQLQLKSDNHLYVTVRDRLSADQDSLRIGQIMTHLFFIPDGKAEGSVEPLEFAWIPNLHRTEEGVVGDHFFRSPAVILFNEGLYVSMIPDLDLFAKNHVIQHAMDFRTFATGRIEAPRLSFGICPYEVDGHIYTKHRPDFTVPFNGKEISYAFNLFMGKTDSRNEVTKMTTTFLWDTYGHKYFNDIRPQVLPFEEYGRQYTYHHELPRSTREVVINDEKCIGLNSPRGATFHAWWNNLHVGFGIRHYGEKWNDPELQDIAEGILQLILQAPRNQGAFPCIYNFNDNRYEGTVYWTARAADYLNGYDNAAMGVTSWWLLYWNENFNNDSNAILNAVFAYTKFLLETQLPSGAFPTYYFRDLSPAKQLMESATTAICGAVLAKTALLSGDAELKKAALKSGLFMEEKIIPELLFNDFETYYSCSPKPLYAIDYWSGIRPHNNLSLQWACDQMLALYRLTGESKWLKQGEYLLSILSLYQQVWNPVHREGYLFGGFGVMNTDGEWSDGRGARFVITYADYYTETGKIEYLERAIAASRAPFALMDMPENHNNDINQWVLGKQIDARDAAQGQAEPGMGYSGENAIFPKSLCLLIYN